MPCKFKERKMWQVLGGERLIVCVLFPNHIAACTVWRSSKQAVNLVETAALLLSAAVLPSEGRWSSSQSLLSNVVKQIMLACKKKKGRRQKNGYSWIYIHNKDCVSLLWTGWYINKVKVQLRWHLLCRNMKSIGAGLEVEGRPFLPKKAQWG